MATSTPTNAKETTIQVWTDGSAGLDVICGCGVAIRDSAVLHELAAAVTDPLATCNRAEMYAVLIALDHTPPHIPITIHSDSQIVVKGWNGEYGRKANTDLWAEIEAATRGRTVTMIWTKGHRDDMMNLLADKLARSAVTKWRTCGAALTAAEPPEEEPLPIVHVLTDRRSIMDAESPQASETLKESLRRARQSHDSHDLKRQRAVQARRLKAA